MLDDTYKRHKPSSNIPPTFYQIFHPTCWIKCWIGLTRPLAWKNNTVKIAEFCFLKKTILLPTANSNTFRLRKFRIQIIANYFKLNERNPPKISNLKCFWNKYIFNSLYQNETNTEQKIDFCNKDFFSKYDFKFESEFVNFSARLMKVKSFYSY